MTSTDPDVQAEAHIALILENTKPPEPGGERLYWVHGFKDGRPHINAEVPGMSPEEAMQTAVAQNAELLWEGDYSGPVWSECQRSEVQDVTHTTDPRPEDTVHFVFANGWWHKTDYRTPKPKRGRV